MTVHQFSPIYEISIADIKLALRKQKLSLFYELTESEITSINNYVLQRAKLKKELIARIKQLKKEFLLNSLKVEKKKIKIEIKQQESQLRKLYSKKGNSIKAKSQSNPLNPNRYKYGYISIITTAMGNKR